MSRETPQDRKIRRNKRIRDFVEKKAQEERLYRALERKKFDRWEADQFSKAKRYASRLIRGARR